MSITQERIKNRREYLKQKGTAYTKIGLAGLLIVPCLYFAVFFLSVLYYPGRYYWQAFSLSALLVFIFGGGCYWLIYRAYRIHKSTSQFPYVPPISNDTLPIEEVLVRGSEEPVQVQSNVLLRGTVSIMNTKEQELLRGSQR